MFRMLGVAVAAVVLSCAGAAGAATQLDQFNVTVGSVGIVNNSPAFPEACRSDDPCLNLTGARLESNDTFTLLQRPWDGRNDWATILVVARNSGSGFDETFYLGFNIDGVDYKTYFTIPTTLLWWDLENRLLFGAGNDAWSPSTTCTFPGAGGLSTCQRSFGGAQQVTLDFTAGPGLIRFTIRVPRAQTFSCAPSPTYCYTDIFYSDGTGRIESAFAAGDAGEWSLVAFDPTAVPEPATWALSIAGFGLAGAALRRRRVVLA